MPESMTFDEFYDALTMPSLYDSDLAKKKQVFRRLFDFIGPERIEAVLDGKGSPRHRLKRGDRIKRGEKALNDLSMSVTTNADKERIARVWVALKDLDDEQAEAKDKIDAIEVKQKPDLTPLRELAKELCANRVNHTQVDYDMGYACGKVDAGLALDATLDAIEKGGA